MSDENPNKSRPITSYKELLKELKKKKYSYSYDAFNKKIKKNPNAIQPVPMPSPKLPKLTKEEKELQELQMEIRRRQSLEKDPSGVIQLLNEGGIAKGQGVVSKIKKFKVY